MENMKKISFVWVFAMLIVGFPAASVFSQDAAGPVDNSEFYAMQVFIEKIYAEPNGYFIEYRRNGLGRNSVIIPKSWFTKKVGSAEPLKGEMVRMNGGNIGPYMTIYYKDGKTDHVRLYVRENSHKTWGSGVPPSANFDNVDAIEDIIIER
jgi:hypothetical protein